MKCVRERAKETETETERERDGGLGGERELCWVFCGVERLDWIPHNLSLTRGWESVKTLQGMGHF